MPWMAAENWVLRTPAGFCSSPTTRLSVCRHSQGDRFPSLGEGVREFRQLQRYLDVREKELPCPGSLLTSRMKSNVQESRPQLRERSKVHRAARRTRINGWLLAFFAEPFKRETAPQGQTLEKRVASLKGNGALEKTESHAWENAYAPSRKHPNSGQIALHLDRLTVG